MSDPLRDRCISRLQDECSHAGVACARVGSLTDEARFRVDECLLKPCEEVNACVSKVQGRR